MNFVSRIGLGTLVMAGLLGAASAGDEVVTTDHQLLKGNVVSSTNDAVVFEHAVDGASQTLTIPADKIEPHSFYVVRKKAVAGDAAGMVALGDYCSQHGMPTYARNLYFDASKLDPSLGEKLGAKIDATRAGSAAQMLVEVKALAAKGEPDAAYERCVSIVRFYPSTPSADEARTLAVSLRAQVTERTATEAGTPKASAAGSAAGDPPAGGSSAGNDPGGSVSDESAPGDSLEQLVHKDIARGDAQRTKGHASKTQSEQLESYRAAQNAYKEALDALDRLAAERAGKSTGDLDGVRAKATNDLIGAHIDAGCVLLARTDFEGAMNEANAALVVDPDDFQAKTFRARVAQASADAR